MHAEYSSMSVAETVKNSTMQKSVCEKRTQMRIRYTATLKA
jgi:hypothetical protein